MSETVRYQSKIYSCQETGCVPTVTVNPFPLKPLEGKPSYSVIMGVSNICNKTSFSWLPVFVSCICVLLNSPVSCTWWQLDLSQEKKTFFLVIEKEFNMSRLLVKACSSLDILTCLRRLRYECRRLKFCSRTPSGHLNIEFSFLSNLLMTSTFSGNRSKNHSHNQLNRKQQLLWSCFAFITRNVGQHTATRSLSAHRTAKNSHLW